MSAQEELAKFHLEKAYKLLRDARIILEHDGTLDTVINRLYYSCYNAFCLLTVLEGLEVKTHNGLRKLIVERFVGPGLVTRTSLTTFSELMNGRTDADYDVTNRPSRQKVAQWFDATEDLLAEVQHYLNSRTGTQKNDNGEPV